MDSEYFNPEHPMYEGMDAKRRELYIQAFELLARAQTLLLDARLAHEAHDREQKEKSLCCHTLASLAGKPLC